MKKILILSDTHGLLRDEIKAELVGCDFIIHAGDFHTPDVFQTLLEFGPFYPVRGNNDKEWAENLQQSLTVKVEGVRFFIVHNKKDVPKTLSDIDVIIYGHSHQYEEKIIDGVLWLNPGSCGKRRFHLEISMCRMYVDQGNYHYEKVILP